MDDGGIYFHLLKTERHLERSVDDVVRGGGCVKDFIGPPAPADLRTRAAQEFNIQGRDMPATGQKSSSEIAVEPKFIVEKPPAFVRGAKVHVFIAIPFDLKK